MHRNYPPRRGNGLWRSGVMRLLGVSLMHAAVSASAQPVTLNLKDADLTSLAAAVSQVTGKTFVIDPRVKARVTVISARPMEEADLYALFLSILSVHGLAAVPGDHFVKIVPEANAKTDQIPTITAPREAEGDQVVTRILTVRHASVTQLLAMLRPLVPAQGHLAVAGSNALVISDRAANVERIAELVARVDVPSAPQTEVIALRHANAASAVRLLEGTVLPAAGPDAGATGGLRAQADERTNSVLITGDQEARARARALLARLDLPYDTTGNAQVVFLRFAKAKDLAAILQGFGKSLDQVAPAGVTGNTPTALAGAGFSVQADEANNALLLNASPAMLRTLRAMITQLDVRRAQVMVEAVIAELSVERSSELGVQWLVDASNGGAIGVVNFDNLLLTLGNAALDRTLPASLPSGGQLAVGVQAGSVRFGALISALQSHGDTNVLSTPTLVSLDNEEAEIIVGQNVPFVTGSFTTSVAGGGAVGGLTGNPFQTIQRQDVGLSLKIKPQINAGSAVRLELQQEVSSVASVSPSQGPTTNKRALKTSVLVENDQILVLGGLIDDNTTSGEDRVPLLGDLPLLGGLFRHDTAKKTKRNLMVFLHPVILRDADSGSAQSAARYEAMRAAQLQAAAAAGSRGDTRSAVLPPLSLQLPAEPSVETYALQPGFSFQAPLMLPAGTRP